MYNFKYALVVGILVVTWTNDVEALKRGPVISAPSKKTTTPPPEENTENNEDPARDVAEPAQSAASDSILSRVVGNDVKVKPYDPMLYEGSSGGPVKTGDDLECKGGQICCWANGDNSSVTTVQWQSASGLVDSSKFQASFDTQKQPDEHFLVAYSENKQVPKERALYESCSINCVDGDIQVSFRYWTTPGIILQVCTRDAFFGDTNSLSNCRSAKSDDKQSGQAQVTVSGGHLIAIDIVATGFTADAGSVAIIGQIITTFKPCQTSGGNDKEPEAKVTSSSTAAPDHTSPSTRQTPSPSANQSPAPSTEKIPPSSKGSEERQQTANVDISKEDRTINCPKLRCRFDKDTLCGYSEYRLVRASASPLRSTKGFAVRRGRFDNPLTGAIPPEDGGKYAAAYLYGQDSASVHSEQVQLSQPRVLRFRCFLGAQGLRLKMCLDNERNCPFISNSSVKIGERKKWKIFNVLLPKGTKQVFFMAENVGDNQGAVGIHNIELLRPSRGSLDAESTEGSACG